VTGTAQCERLLADIGGTNARFAWQRHAGAQIEAVQTLPCAGFETLADAIQAYLGIVDRPAPPLCAIAIANPVLGDWVQMTNHHWRYSIAALRAQFGFADLRLLNDFTALALALPALQRADLQQVGGGVAVPAAAIGLIGPGTGLGVSGLIPDGRGGWSPLQGEGGHVTLAAGTPREQAVVGELARRHGHVSAERAVCGQGLVDLHRALWALDRPRGTAPDLAAADITAAALAGSDPACTEALQLFCALLGATAGNLALTLGARGGIYIGGGIVPRLGPWFARSDFRARFEGKGRFSAYLAPIPVWVIGTAQSPALLGAARALEQAWP
jgi:glucokinase